VKNLCEWFESMWICIEAWRVMPYWGCCEKVRKVCGGGEALIKVGGL